MIKQPPKLDVETLEYVLSLIEKKVAYHAIHMQSYVSFGRDSAAKSTQAKIATLCYLGSDIQKMIDKQQEVAA